MYENKNKQQKINCKKLLSKKDSDYFFTGVYREIDLELQEVPHSLIW